MKKRLVMIMVLFTMILNTVFNYGQSMNYIVENDGEIEWNSYTEERIV